MKNFLVRSMYIKSVKSENPSKITIEILKNVLLSNENENVAKISTVPFNHFNAYLKILGETLFHKNLKDFSENQDNSCSEARLTYFDILAWQSEQKEWEQRIKSNQTNSTTLVNIETNVNQNIVISVSTMIEKPSLLENSTYDFGTLEVDTSKRGSISVINPSHDPITVSFFIAPSTFLENIFQELMSDESLIKWMVLCEKITFFNPFGRKMCQEFLKINVLNGERMNEVISFFFQNYFNLISNDGHIEEELFINFIEEQKNILKKKIINITESSNATKPEELNKCGINCEEDNYISSFFSKLNPFSKSAESFKDQIPKIDPAKGEQYEEIVESIKVKLNQWIDEYPQNVNNEFKTLLNTRRQNFFIEQKSKCHKHKDQSLSMNFGKNDCYLECDQKVFHISPQSSVNYHCFHFHPTLAVDKAESYLLIKNNLTYIHPLKLIGSSGKAIFKITDLKAPAFQSIDYNQIKYQKQPVDPANPIDIIFNLNMKHDVFRVKNLDTFAKKDQSQNRKSTVMGAEKITVKNIVLIRKHTRRFNISNVGNFPTEILEVTLSNHRDRHNRLTLRKLDGKEGYEIMYEPDFRHSLVEETILVKTENSVTEFTIQANIPMYLIKFIDKNFRLTEVEEYIGNWYYFIVLSFVLLTVLLLGTELVEYIIYLKQKNINYTLLTELIHAYEKTKELAEEELKIENLKKILEKSQTQNQQNSQNLNPKSKKGSPKKGNVQQKKKLITINDFKAEIEEIKKKL